MKLKMINGTVIENVDFAAINTINGQLTIAINDIENYLTIRENFLDESNTLEITYLSDSDEELQTFIGYTKMTILTESFEANTTTLWLRKE